MIVRLLPSKSNDGVWMPECGLNGLGVSFFVGRTWVTNDQNLHLETEKPDHFGYTGICASRVIRIGEELMLPADCYRVYKDQPAQQSRHVQQPWMSLISA